MNAPQRTRPIRPARPPKPVADKPVAPSRPQEETQALVKEPGIKTDNVHIAVEAEQTIGKGAAKAKEALRLPSETQAIVWKDEGQAPSGCNQRSLDQTQALGREAVPAMAGARTQQKRRSLYETQAIGGQTAAIQHQTQELEEEELRPAMIYDPQFDEPQPPEKQPGAGIQPRAPYAPQPYSPQQYAQPQYAQPRYMQQPYAQPQAGYANPAAARPVGQLNDRRSLLKFILLGIITFGIYDLVFFSGISSDINIIASRYDGRKTMHYCLLFFLIGPLTFEIGTIVWFHKMSARLGDELRRRGIDYSFGAGSFWGWNILGLFILVGPFIYIYKLAKASRLLAANYNRCG